MIAPTDRTAAPDGTGTLPSIALLDNDDFTLHALSLFIEESRLGTVLWTTGSAYETIRRCCGDRRQRPDLLLVDMSLNVMSGAEVCRRIRAVTASVPMLAVTAFPVHLYERDAALAGAQGIVSKSDTRALASAIRIVGAGGTWGNAFMSAKAGHIRLRARPDDDDGVPLTSRETEVMELLAAGYNGPQVARTLGIADSTAKTLIARARRKLGADTLRQAVVLWNRRRA